MLDRARKKQRAWGGWLPGVRWGLQRSQQLAPHCGLKGESRPWGWDVEGEAGALGPREKPLFLPRRL